MDDDSLSRRAADFTAQWVADANQQRYQDSIDAAGRSGSWGGGTAPGISGLGVLALAAVLGGLAGSLGGGDHWVASALIYAGVFVGLSIAAIVLSRLLGWTWRLGARSAEATGAFVGKASGTVIGTVLGGLLGATLRGGVLGGAVGAALARMAGDDIAVMEGITMFAPVGVVLALLVHLIRRRRVRS